MYYMNPDPWIPQLLIVVLATNSAEFAITIAAIPIVLILLGFCGVAVQREIKWYIPFLKMQTASANSFYRLMTASLLMMLAAMSYCKDKFDSLPHRTDIYLCGFSWFLSLCVLLFHGVPNQSSIIAVYKLVRFYEPGSRDQYATTRATLTIFSKYLYLLFSAF